MGSSLWTQTNQDAFSYQTTSPEICPQCDMTCTATLLRCGCSNCNYSFDSEALSHVYSGPFWIKHYRYLQTINGSITNFNHSYRSDASASKLQQSAWAHFLSITGNFSWLPSSSHWRHENCFDVSSFKPLQSKSTLASNPLYIIPSSNFHKHWLGNRFRATSPFVPVKRQRCLEKFSGVGGRPSRYHL